MDDDLSQQEILKRVAAGTLSPEDAAPLLEQVAAPTVTTAGDAQPPSSGPDATSGMNGGADDRLAQEALIGKALSPDAPMPVETSRVLVRATSRRVRVVGDPTVATVAVDGEHTARREDGTLIISGDTAIGAPDDAFVLIAGGRWGEVADRAARGIFRDLELKVRVRPDLPVGVEVIAGSVHVEGAMAMDHIRVTAGSLRAEDLQSPVDVLVQAGSAQVSGRFKGGKSRVRCESGSLTLTMTEGSDVRVHSDVQLGRVVAVPERRNRNRDIVVGAGAGELDLEVVMGQVTVNLPESDGVYQ